MPLVASVDYPAKRIYLSVETVGASLDTLAIYKEVRALRRVTEAHRQFVPGIVAFGNETKIAGQTFTPIYIRLGTGWRIVPFDAAQTLRLVRDTFAADGVAGVGCFDRSAVANPVDIDVDFPEVEIREVTVGGGGAPTASENAAAVRASITVELARVLELAALHGLVAGSPLVVTPTSRTAGSVVQTVSEAAGTVTVTRA